MPTDHESSYEIDDSEQYVRPVLNESFDLKEVGLQENALLAYLTTEIHSRLGTQPCVVSIVGGAGSGKSVLTQALVESLARQDLVADSISTDDYNLGNRTWRWEHFEGTEVRDPMDKWDFKLMNQKIAAIRSNNTRGATVKVPTYDQATGLAIDAGEENYTHEIGKIDVLVVEGDMFQVDNPDFAIYLHTTDSQRLQNRTNRDVTHRNAGDAAKIAANFALRHQNQHVPYTLPAIESADVVIDVKVADEGDWAYDLYRTKQATL
jgi:uridine kinase